MQERNGQLKRLGEDWAAARTTLVFVEEQERWMLLGLHLSPIAGPPAGLPAQASNEPGESA